MTSRHTRHTPATLKATHRWTSTATPLTVDLSIEWWSFLFCPRRRLRWSSASHAGHPSPRVAQWVRWSSRLVPAQRRAKSHESPPLSPRTPPSFEYAASVETFASSARRRQHCTAQTQRQPHCCCSRVPARSFSGNSRHRHSLDLVSAVHMHVCSHGLGFRTGRDSKACLDVP